MQFSRCILLFVSLFTISFAQAQLCTGSLGDPVVKIDFGSGTATHGAALGTGVTSYTYTSADFPNDGSYTVESRTNTAGTWWTTTDHTGGGYMMVVNASLSITDYFYKKTVTGLCPDTTYEFAAWIMNLLKGTDRSTPNITFTIESESGTILATYNTGDIALSGSAVWKQYGFFFDTPQGLDTVVIRMRNNKIGAAPGNDIALDDITFRACGPEVVSAVSNNTSTSITVCENQVPQYTFTGGATTSVYTTPAYQWQTSTDNGTTWTDIAGATATTTTVQPPQTAGVYMYRLSTAESANIASLGCRVASNVITITVKAGLAAPTVTVSPTDCSNPSGTITITAPLGYTYSINGTDYQSSTIFTGLSQKEYSVTAKDAASDCPSAITKVNVTVGAGIPNAPVVNAIGPATCADTNGTITVTDVAAGYSYDNGVTWVTTNTAAKPAGDYQVKVKNASGCESDATTVTVPAATGFPPAPTVTTVQPDCTTPTGTITVTVNNALDTYSFDGGATWGTTNWVVKSANTYTVLTKNTLGCVSPATTVVLSPYVNNEPLPVADAAQTFCLYSNALVSDITITGTNIKWYDAATAGNLLPASTALQDGKTYYATQTVTVCESNRVAVTVTVLDVAAPTGDAAQQFCTTQIPTVALLEATGTAIQWYDVATGGNLLAATTALTNGTTYYATQTISGCDSQTRFSVTVTIISPSIPVSNVATYVCDELNDGTEAADLTTYTSGITVDADVTFSFYKTQAGADSADAAQLITDPSAYALALGDNIIYVRADSSDKCYQVVQIALTLTPVPVINIADTLALCENKTLVINAGQVYDSYLWSTQATTPRIIVSEPGDYSLTVTKKHGDVVCTTVKNFTVILSNVATISTIEISDWTVSNNTIAIYLAEESLGDYEYSIDGTNFQDSNIFTDLDTGAYTVYVRDKYGCGSTNQEVYILNYPKFFTPNGDGSHDNWHVQFAAYEPGLQTEIFDRYGQLISVLGYQQAWDGNFNGHPLPSTDYWFVVKRANGKQYKGHFSMVR